MKATQQQTALEKAKEKRLLGKPEGQKVREEREEHLKNFPEDEEDREVKEDGEDLTPLYGSLEAKLLQHQEALVQRQLALETKL